MPQQTETLATYRTRFLRVVKDATQQFYNAQGQAAGTLASYADIDAWLNEGIRWRDLWSGGSRSYRAAVALTQGLDQYDLGVLFPNDTVLDIVNLWLIWGNRRLQLKEQNLSYVTAFYRQQVGFTNVPAAFCRYGATGLFIATAPGSAYTADFDAAVLSGTLAAPADLDPLPYPYTEPVVYYAASLGESEGRQRYQQGEIHMATAMQKLRDIESSRAGELPGIAGGRK